MQTVIYKSFDGSDKVTNINDSQKVLTKDAWSEVIPESIDTITIKEPSPIDPAKMVDVQKTIKTPAHTVTHPKKYELLSGLALVDWFVVNQMIEPGFDIPKYFVVPAGGKMPSGQVVANVDYGAKTWTDQLLVVTSSMVKAEARRRIISVLKDEATQRNMTALASQLVNKKLDGVIDAAGTATLASLNQAFDWVQAMQQAGRDMAATLDPDYQNDMKWPAVPAGLAALVAQF